MPDSKFKFRIEVRSNRTGMKSWFAVIKDVASGKIRYTSRVFLRRQNAIKDAKRLHSCMIKTEVVEIIEEENIYGEFGKPIKRFIAEHW